MGDKKNLPTEKYNKKNSISCKRALFVTTTASMIDQFNRGNIALLQKMGYEVHVACNLTFGNSMSTVSTQKFIDDMNEIGVRIFDYPFTRHPFAYGRNLRLSWKLRKQIKKYRYKIIHCHTPVGSVAARIAAAFNVKKWGGRVIYTAHGFHFYRGAPLKNWLIFYPIERELSWFTDTLITINTEDYACVKNSFHARDIVYVPGVGVDTNVYTDVGLSKKKKNDLRDKKLPVRCSLNNVILFSVGELNDNKNHRVVIEALGRLNDPNIYYFIAGIGGNKENLQKRIEELGLSKRVHLLGYRDDIEDLMRLSDVFILPSKREGLNVSLMEAMSSGLPCVVSDIRGNRDLIKQGQGGYLLEPNNIDKWEKILRYICNSLDKRIKLGENNRETMKRFSKYRVQKIMKKIYNDDKER
ncbi:MAG: glycosyltransferase family 4 protein [Selenomonas ruminantium]|uniref:Glycosyltransferase family 4 protein n=1 Tax=Selenomonas ruminantium TaxID=971 RepID=A0A927WPN1_SELRU|nr:glycosyltransferase family 4 protein [Selenomonas ruminantium]